MSGFLKSPFVGLDNFITIFQLPTFRTALTNTIIISLLKLAVCFPITIVFSLMLNEITQPLFKRVFQTVSYLPYFISWVIAAGIWYKLLSFDHGLLNEMLMALGITQEPIFFMGETKYFYWIIIITELWKNLGFNAIIYLAQLSSIDPQLYEAAHVDGAGKLRKIWHISLPGIKDTIVLLFIFAAAGLMNAGFDQLWTLGNLNVRDAAEILDTFILRSLRNSGMVGLSITAAMGVFKSVVGLILFLACNFLAKILGEESII